VIADTDYWVGIDAGHTECAICLIDRAGTVLLEAVRDSNAGAVTDILRVFGVERVQAITIEAGVGVHIVRKLLDRGLPITVVDPRKSSKFLSIRRQKTDPSDARGLAELGRLGVSIGAGIHINRPDQDDIRIQLNVRRSILNCRIRTDAAIRSILHRHGASLSVGNSPGKLRFEVTRVLLERKRQGYAVRADLMRLVAVGEVLRSQLADLDREMSSLAKSIDVCANLQTMPGVGPLTALSFYSAIGDPHRFSRNADVGPYLGLAPALRQSGATAHRGRVGRFGNKMARSHLIMGATLILTQCKADSKLRSWGLDLMSRTNFIKARVAVARKMAVVLLQMWKGGVPFDAKL